MTWLCCDVSQDPRSVDYDLTSDYRSVPQWLQANALLRRVARI